MNSLFQDGYSQFFTPSPPPTGYIVSPGPAVGLKFASKKVSSEEWDLPAQLQGAGRGLGTLRGWAGEMGGEGARRRSQGLHGWRSVRQLDVAAAAPPGRELSPAQRWGWGRPLLDEPARTAEKWGGGGV